MVNLFLWWITIVLEEVAAYFGAASLLLILFWGVAIVWLIGTILCLRVVYRSAPGKAVMLGVLFLIPLFVGGYLLVNMQRAHRKVEWLCAQAVVGGPVEGLAAKAKHRGLRVTSASHSPEKLAELHADAGFGFPGVGRSRWRCVIEYVDGTVVSKHTALDADWRLWRWFLRGR